MVYSQLGVPLVDSLLDNSIASAREMSMSLWGWGGGSSHPHSAYFNYICHRLSEKRIKCRMPILL